MQADKIENMMNISVIIQNLKEASDKETKKELLNRLLKHDAQLFSQQDVENILTFLRDQAPSVRARAASVLGHCKSNTYLDNLIALTADKDDVVAEVAAIALGEIGNSKAVDAIQKVLTRMENILQRANDAKSRQRIIKPLVYPDNPARTILSFQQRSCLGHDKAGARTDRRIADANQRLESVREALQKCSQK